MSYSVDDKGIVRTKPEVIHTPTHTINIYPKKKYVKKKLREQGLPADATGVEIEETGGVRIEGDAFNSQIYGPGGFGAPVQPKPKDAVYSYYFGG